MKHLETKKWDMAENIKTKEDVFAYLQGALEENDPQFLLKIIEYIVRSEGMKQLVTEMQLQNEFEKKNLSFTTVAQILDKMGYQINVMKKAS
jgi:probable addiction module antidote protein